MVDKAELHHHMMADIEKSVKRRAELIEQFEM